MRTLNPDKGSKGHNFLRYNQKMRLKQMLIYYHPSVYAAGNHSARTTRLRPAFFALYRALSASLNTISGVGLFLSGPAIPTLIVTFAFFREFEAFFFPLEAVFFAFFERIWNFLPDNSRRTLSETSKASFKPFVSTPLWHSCPQGIKIRATPCRSVSQRKAIRQIQVLWYHWVSSERKASLQH